ncbi:hypothetical protein FB45DRAFT_115733 [Roridomyces roridus]|uniref:F-box domain-containing protein n=1 Tax=Roridomyces roridus TaxID=1738132 RepID=A0AAD7FKB6_9AGAR|nr:hypothetical protein FB45DRAFT_115733 [Roridomyces roridus]
MSRCSQCGELTIPKIEDSTAPDPVADISSTAHHSRLLSTNEPPPEGPVLAYVHDVVSKTSLRLATVDKNITDLRAHLKQLEDERSLLSDSLQKNISITSPLRRMPPEVLAEVFFWTLPEEYKEPAKIDQSPWVLGHICSRWRTIALSIPFLWSKFYIARATDEPNLYPPLPMIETQIQRTRTLGIHFF